MENTLKVTNVLSDPTRYKIYQSFLETKTPKTVADIADLFNIHPNVARLHLTKLQEIKLLNTYYEKSGKGGRPKRVYILSDHVIELTFPHRDYKMLAEMMLKSLINLGDVGKKALYETGKAYGEQIMLHHAYEITNMDTKEKFKLLEEKSSLLGMYPHFSYDENKNSIHFTITNCPFKEIAEKDSSLICNMHNQFIKGMLHSVFPDAKLYEKENMFEGCENCRYVVEIS